MSPNFTRQLARAPWLAGDSFNAADISVGYAMLSARKNIAFAFGHVERAYLARLEAWAGYEQALEVCWATRDWWMS